MKTLPKISETEWEIMRIVWSRHPLKAADIIAELTARDASWHPKTARTLLARLVEKGALSYTENGRSYLYAPLITEEQASGSFLDRIFGGSLKPMLVHFLENKKLSKHEIDELRQLLDKSKPGSPAASPADKPAERKGHA